MKDMKKLKFIALAAACCLGLAAQATSMTSWSVEMPEKQTPPYAPGSGKMIAGQWYDNMTVYLLDELVTDSDTIKAELAKGNLSVLTGKGCLDCKTGVDSGSITGWTIPDGGTEITVDTSMGFIGHCDATFVFLTDASTSPAMYAVACATASAYTMDMETYDPVTFAQIGDPGEWTYLPVKYVAPVYVDNVASNGIAYWTTNTVPSGYTIIESAASRVTWGESGTTNWYVVTNGMFQIDGGVECKGNVHLVLCDGAKLTVTNVANYKAGIQTDASGSFTIYGTPEGAGELSATSGYCGAGIGGSNEDDKYDGSHITINGGKVTATGAARDNDGGGAGIGGGCYGAGSDIVINGGVVHAEGVSMGAGIGGGYRNSGSDIVINGGDVSAEGVSCGAGIGGGNKADGRNIVINGGVVVAKSPKEGAGIGGGLYGVGSDIAINGGEVSVCAAISDWGGFFCVADFIGSGDASAAAKNVSIADSANVCFNLTGVLDWENEEWIVEPAPSPKDFKGFMIMTPETQTVSRVLVGGVANWTAATTLPLTNAVTGATGTIDIGGAPRRFASANLKLKHADGQLTLNVFDATQVGEDAWAGIEDGDCTIFGTGATWAKSDWTGGNPLKDYDAAITNLVVADGITGLGANSFENFWYLQNVDLAASVTDVGDRAFKKCYGLTHVTSQATGASTVGAAAFSGCHSLETLSFAGAPTFGDDAYSFQTAIYMKDGGIPVVYTMPTITVAGKTEHVMGKKALTDDIWTDVTEFTDDAKKDYHFFKIEMRQ